MTHSEKRPLAPGRAAASSNSVHASERAMNNATHSATQAPGRALLMDFLAIVVDARDTEFLRSIAEQLDAGRGLSERQAAWLAAIRARIEAAHGDPYRLEL